MPQDVLCSLHQQQQHLLVKPGTTIFLLVLYQGVAVLGTVPVTVVLATKLYNLINIWWFHPKNPLKKSYVRVLCLMYVKHRSWPNHSNSQPSPILLSVSSLSCHATDATLDVTTQPGDILWEHMANQMPSRSAAQCRETTDIMPQKRLTFGRRNPR